MKKFASIVTSVFLAGTLIFSGIAAVSATAPNKPDETKTGSISLTKYDPSKITTNEAGEIVAKEGVDAADIYVAGSTFTAYKVLDYANGTYTVNSSFEGVAEVSDVVNVSASEAGTISYGSTDELEAQISKLQQHALNPANNVTGTSATTDANGSATISDLGLGVYLVAETSVPAGYIVSSQSFLVTIPQWNQDTNEWVYDITAKPKNENLQVEKKLAGNTSSDSYSIGDVINYDVQVNVPNYGMSTDYPTLKVTDNMAANDPENKGKEKFNKLDLVFTDTLSKGLTLDASSIVVKVGENTLTLGEAANLKKLDSAVFTENPDNVALTTLGTADYTVSTTTEADDSTKLVITIAWAAVNEMQGQLIDIKYDAQLDNDAVAGTANNNTITYDFSRDPQKVPAGEVEDPTRTTTTDTDNDVYTYEMDLTKQFNNKNADSSIDASAVTFEVQDTAGNVQNLIKNADGSYSIWTGTTKKVILADGSTKTVAVSVVEKTTAESVTEGAETIVADIITSANPTAAGALVIKGLEAGTYNLVETSTVNGYTLLTSPITIVVEEVMNTEDNTVVTSEVKAFVQDNDDNADNNQLLSVGGNTGSFAITVNNSKNQFNLPETGGLGLWMFTIAGGIIMAGAIIFIAVIRKKKEA